MCGDDVDLVDGQPTGSVRISFGYMSTLEDAQAFLKFIIATRLRPPSSQPVPQPALEEAGAPPAEREPRNTVPATVGRHSPPPQEDTPTDSRLWGDLPTAAEAVGLDPPLPEATRTWETPSEKAAGVLDGDLGPHVLTNLYLYPIKSCAAFEVRDFSLLNLTRGLVIDFRGREREGERERERNIIVREKLQLVASHMHPN